MERYVVRATADFEITVMANSASEAEEKALEIDWDGWSCSYEITSVDVD